LEITLKYAAGKLPLPGSPRTWIPLRRSFFGLESLALTESSIFLSGELPTVHADPFDRLLAAQALDKGFTLLSPDSFFSRLGAHRLW
jgi:PIN domain nuclease of toxin-antitoxin system